MKKTMFVGNLRIELTSALRSNTSQSSCSRRAAMAAARPAGPAPTTMTSLTRSGSLC